jgi:hypothetical protein
LKSRLRIKTIFRKRCGFLKNNVRRKAFWSKLKREGIIRNPQSEEDAKQAAGELNLTRGPASLKIPKKNIGRDIILGKHGEKSDKTPQEDSYFG